MEITEKAGGCLTLGWDDAEKSLVEIQLNKTGRQREDGSKLEMTNGPG
jgi:hypothetical protein